MVETPVKTVAEALACIERGRGQRAVAATKVHEHSSRSHSIVMVTVGNQQSDKPPGRLFLVDLAGSERVKKSGVTGEELREAQHINRYVRVVVEGITMMATRDSQPAQPSIHPSLCNQVS